MISHSTNCVHCILYGGCCHSSGILDIDSNLFIDSLFNRGQPDSQCPPLLVPNLFNDFLANDSFAKGESADTISTSDGQGKHLVL